MHEKIILRFVLLLLCQYSNASEDKFREKSREAGAFCSHHRSDLPYGIETRQLLQGLGCNPDHKDTIIFKQDDISWGSKVEPRLYLIQPYPSEDSNRFDNMAKYTLRKNGDQYEGFATLGCLRSSQKDIINNNFEFIQNAAYGNCFHSSAEIMLYLEQNGIDIETWLK